MSGRTSASSVESLSPQSLRTDCWNIGFPALRRNCTPGPRDWNCSQEWSIEPGAKRRPRGLSPSGVGLIEPKVTNIPVEKSSKANLLLVIIEIRLIFLMPDNPMAKSCGCRVCIKAGFSLLGRTSQRWRKAIQQHATGGRPCARCPTLLPTRKRERMTGPALKTFFCITRTLANPG